MALRWEIVVRLWDHYGEKTTQSWPTSIVAIDRNEVTEKVRAAYNATYDSFREFWSHDWRLVSTSEIYIYTPVSSEAEMFGNIYDKGFESGYKQALSDHMIRATHD